MFTKKKLQLTKVVKKKTFTENELMEILLDLPTGILAHCSYFGSFHKCYKISYSIL